MRDKIAFIVATQYDNVGDLLINKCLINELSKHSDVYLDLKNVPIDFQELLLLDTKNVFKLSGLTPRSFKGIGAFSFLFQNHGITRVFNSPGPFGSNGNKKAFIKNFLLGMIFLLLSLNSIKSYLVGNDIKFVHKLDRFNVKFISSICVKVLCRSIENVLTLKRNGIYNAEYIPDMCFGYSPKILIEDKPNCIGVSFRKIEDPIYQKSIINTVSNLLNEIEENYSLVFFYQVKQDYSFNKDLYELFKERKNVYFRKECLEWDDIDFYNSLSFTLSNRLHVLLLGAVYHVIPLALLNGDVKTEKIKGIFKSVNTDNLIFESEIETVQIKSLLYEKPELERQVIKVNTEQKNIINNQIKALF